MRNGDTNKTNGVIVIKADVFRKYFLKHVRGAFARARIRGEKIVNGVFLVENVTIAVILLHALERNIAITEVCIKFYANLIETI